MKKLIAGLALSGFGVFLVGTSYLAAGIFYSGPDVRWGGMDIFLPPLLLGWTLIVTGIALVITTLLKRDE